MCHDGSGSEPPTLQEAPQPDTSLPTYLFGTESNRAAGLYLGVLCVWIWMGMWSEASDFDTLPTTHCWSGSRSWCALLAVLCDTKRKFLVGWIQVVGFMSIAGAFSRNALYFMLSETFPVVRAQWGSHAGCRWLERSTSLKTGSTCEERDQATRSHNTRVHSRYESTVKQPPPLTPKHIVRHPNMFMNFHRFVQRCVDMLLLGVLLSQLDCLRLIPRLEHDTIHPTKPACFLT